MFNTLENYICCEKKLVTLRVKQKEFVRCVKKGIFKSFIKVLVVFVNMWFEFIDFWFMNNCRVNVYCRRGRMIFLICKNKLIYLL